MDYATARELLSEVRVIRILLCWIGVVLFVGFAVVVDALRRRSRP